MTVKQIEAKKAETAIPYTLATQIRELLDAAKNANPKADWVDIEEKVQELVFDDE